MFPFNLQIIGAAALVLASAAAIGGYKVAAARYQHTIDSMVQATQAATIAQQNAAISETYALKAKLTRIHKAETKTVEKIIEKPIYRDCVIDSDGMRELQRAYRD